MTEKIDFRKIADKFMIVGEFTSVAPYGCGHINDTFDLHTTKARYILQRINSNIFRNVEKLMNNIMMVTEYQREQIKKRGGNPDRESLTLIYTKEGKQPFYFDGENYFRIYKFIEAATSFQVVEKPKDFYHAGKAFGNFQNLLANFDASTIYEVIPNFHNTEKRYQDFIDAVEKDAVHKAESVKKEIEFAVSRQGMTGKIVGMLKRGELPLKVTHNDTKLNNVLIDNETGEGVCVIDLDTIMPGSSLYDFGDSIRFGTNPAAEDERDLSKVNMDMNLFEVYVDGFVTAVGDSLTENEAKNLAFSAILMTYECGIRFLADHLSGDTYFKIHRENHNLDRCRTQFKLVEDMEKNLDRMNEIVMKYYKNGVEN